MLLPRFSKLAAETSSYITGPPEVASKDRLSTMLARSRHLGHDVRCWIRYDKKTLSPTSCAMASLEALSAAKVGEGGDIDILDQPVPADFPTGSRSARRQLLGHRWIGWKKGRYRQEHAMMKVESPYACPWTRRFLSDLGRFLLGSACVLRTIPSS